MKKYTRFLIGAIILTTCTIADISNACVVWTGRPGEYTTDESGCYEQM